MVVVVQFSLFLMFSQMLMGFRYVFLLLIEKSSNIYNMWHSMYGQQFKYVYMNFDLV